jgi:hypothetical protein
MTDHERVLEAARDVLDQRATRAAFKSRTLELLSRRDEWQRILEIHLKHDDRSKADLTAAEATFRALLEGGG